MTDWMGRSWSDDAHREDRALAEPAPRPDVTLADVTDDTGYCPVCLQPFEDCSSPGESHGWPM